MEKITIIYPAFAMFLLTISMIFFLGLSRFIAIRKKEVSVKFFQQYNQGEQPERLHILGRHVQNHFEVPPLFYLGVVLIYVTDSLTQLSLSAAWLFVVLRCLHSYIHLGSNNVSYRFFCFGGSLMSLSIMWLSLFVNVLSKA